MTKEEAIAKLGGSVTAAAKALQITPSAISQWPNVLTRSMEDRVLGYMARQMMRTAERPARVS